MAMNKSQSEIRDHRRHRVAYYRLRGLNHREIIAALTNEEELNPKTNKPWSLGIINSDIRALGSEWRAQAARDTETHRATMLAELKEIVRAAWQSDDLTVILRSLKQQAELLGLDEPQQMKHNDFVIRVEYGDRPNGQSEDAAPQAG